MSNLTGQTEDPDAPPLGPGFFQGVDPDFPTPGGPDFDLELLERLAES